MAETLAMQLLIHHLRQQRALEGASEAVWVGQVRAHFLRQRTPVSREIAAFMLSGLVKKRQLTETHNPVTGQMTYRWCHTMPARRSALHVEV